MNCPVCETLLESQTCSVCETVFSQADFDTLRRFDTVLRTTASWTPSTVVQKREQYAEMFARFREQAFVQQRKVWEAARSAATATVPAAALPSAALPSADEASFTDEASSVNEDLIIVAPTHDAKGPTFEQWLFSENTIRTALYSGAFLLILAGLIFVGANWSRLPGFGKLGVTLATTALMCGAGFMLLLRSETLRVGGLALIGIAAGFAPLNFYVIDEYLLESNEAVIWFIGSLVCTLFYVWLVRQTKSALLGLFMAIGVLNTQLALYELVEAEGALIATLLMLLPVPLLLIAIRWRDVPYLFRPNYILSYFLAALIYLGVLVSTLLTDRLYYSESWHGSHWWLVFAVLIGCAYHIINFQVIKSRVSEFIAAAAFCAASLVLLTHLVNLYIVNREGAGQDDTSLGVAFAVLMAIYLVAGFIMPRYRLWLHGTGVLLSGLTLLFTWDAPAIATAVLLVVAAAYVATARLYRNAWLILPAILAIYLSVWSFWQIGTANPETALIVSYAALGVLLLGIGRWFRTDRSLTMLLLDVTGSVTLLMAFLVSISAENLWLAVVLSLVVALTAFAYTWLEQARLLADPIDPDAYSFPIVGVPTTIAALAVFAGHFNLMAATATEQGGNWPLITVVVSATFVALSWLLRENNERHRLYGLPLNLVGLGTLLIPLIATAMFDWWVVATVSSVVGVVAIIDGSLRSGSLVRHYQQLVGIGVLVGALWATLAHYDVAETQWYALSLGLTLLAIALAERANGRSANYLLLTVVGLFVLFGSALAQSFDDVRYAFLLLFESVFAVVFGVRVRSRTYVQLGLLALLVNGLVQYGPAFANLPRFVQIGLVGSTLLFFGLVTLFRREQLIATRDALRKEFREWKV